MSEDRRPTRRVPVAEPPKSKLGVRRSLPNDAVPWVKVSAAKVNALELDHRAGFLLSLIDGRTNVETLLDLAGMEREEAMGLLVEWLSRQVIEMR